MSPNRERISALNTSSVISPTQSISNTTNWTSTATVLLPHSQVGVNPHCRTGVNVIALPVALSNVNPVQDNISRSPAGEKSQDTSSRIAAGQGQDTSMVKTLSSPTCPKTTASQQLVILSQNQKPKTHDNNVQNDVHGEHKKQRTEKDAQNKDTIEVKKVTKFGDVIEQLISTGLGMESPKQKLLLESDTQNTKQRTHSVDETRNSSARHDPGGKRRCLSMDTPIQSMDGLQNIRTISQSVVTQSVARPISTGSDNTDTLTGSSSPDQSHKQSNHLSQNVFSRTYTGTMNITLQTPIEGGTFADKQREFLKRFLKNANVRDLIKKQLDQIPKVNR